MSKKHKNRIKYGYEPFSLQKSLIEKRDEDARRSRVQEKAENERIHTCKCPLCFFFTNSPEVMDTHYKENHIFYAKKKREAES